MTKFLKNINLEAGNDVQFKTTAGANAGNIAQSGDDLVISNPVGDILLGNGSDDVYIGDGTNTVDIRFEQNMAIFADSGSTRTLTIGGTNTNLVLDSPSISGSITLPATTINSKMTFGTSAGYILFDYEPSGDTGEYTTEVPLLKVDLNGSESTILARVSEYRAVVLGIDDTVWLRAGDTGSVIKSNVNLAAEQVVMSAEGGFHAYGFPGNDTSWSNRVEFKFKTDSTTASDNGLYIGDGGNYQFIDLNRNITAASVTSTSGHIKAMGGANVYVYDDSDDTKIHVQAKSNDTEGVLVLSNGSNYGLIARGIQNAPRLGAYHAGSLNIYGFGNSSGADHADDDLLAQFNFSGEFFQVNGALDINGNADISGTATLGNKLTINTTLDNKIDLIVPSSGDTSDWNYIQFIGADGTRDAYFGTTNDGTPSWYRDDGGTQLRLDSTKVYSNSPLQVNGELEATSLDINGAANIDGLLDVNTGSANTVAIFESTDDKAFIRIKDNDTDTHLISKDNVFSIGESSTDYDNFKVNISSGNTTAAGTFTASGLDINGNADIAGNLYVQKSSSHTAQGSFSASDAHLDLYNSLQANTDQKGSIITFTDNYYDGSSYHKTTRAGIKGGTDTTGNTADGYLEFYTDSGGGNSPTLALRLDKDQNATFAGNVTLPASSTLNFSTDIDLIHSTNTLKFAQGGSDRFSISGDVHVIGTTDFAIPAGRKLYLDGQSNTYITESSADNISFFTGGTERLKIDNNGQILASWRFVSEATTTNSLFQAKYNSTNYLEIGYNFINVAGGDWMLQRGGTERLKVTASGIEVNGEVQGDTLNIDGNADISGTLDLSNDLKLDLDRNIRFGGQLAIIKENNGELKFYGGTNSTDGGFEWFTWNGSAYESALTLKNNQTAAFAGNVSIAGNLTTEGDLIINNTSNVSIKDTIITLNSGITVSDTRDIGLMFERVGNNKFFGWDESESHFTLAENTQDVSVATTTQLTMGTLQTLRANVHVDTLSVGSENPAQINAILDEDNMATNSATSLATQQSIKAYADTKLPLAGGTLTDTLFINHGSSDSNLVFQLNGSNKWLIGRDHSPDSFRIYNYGTSSPALNIATSDNTATFAGPITGKDSGIIIDSIGGPYGRIHGTSSIFLGGSSTTAVQLSANLIPDGDSTRDLGSSSRYWKDAYVDSVTTTGDVTVGDDLFFASGAEINFDSNDVRIYHSSDTLTFVDGTLRFQNYNNTALTNIAHQNFSFESLINNSSVTNGSGVSSYVKLGAGATNATGSFSTYRGRAYGENRTSNTDTLTVFHAEYRNWTSTSNTTLNNHYGFKCDALTVGSNSESVTNNFGIYLNPGTTATNNYGVYQAGSNVTNYFQGKVGINTAPAAGVELHVNGEIRVDGTDGVATRMIRSNYFSSSSDIEVRSGASGDIILGDGTARLTLASDDTATFAGSATFASTIAISDGTWHGLTITGSGQGHTQGAIILKSGTSDTPEARGQGVFMFNEGDDVTWYTGTQYQDADTWMVARKAGTGIDSSAATDAQSFFKINNSGNATFAGNVTVSGNLTISGTTTTLNQDTTGSAYALSGSAGSLLTAPSTNELLYTGQINSGTTGLFAAADNSNAIITLNRHSGNYDSQLGFSSNGNIYYRKFSAAAINDTQAWVQVYHSENIIPSADLDADTMHLSVSQDITGHKEFQDSIQLRFGSDNDLKMQHTGSHGYIDSFTGDLYIRNTIADQHIYLKADDGAGSNTVYIDVDGDNQRVQISKPLVLSSGSAVSSIKDEDDMASDSATALATQQSIKAYVDSSVSSAGGGDVTLAGAQTFTGAKTFNATTTFAGTIDSSHITSIGTVKGQRLQAESSTFPQQFIIDSTSGGGNSRTMQIGMSGSSLYLKKSDDTGSIIFRNSNNTNLMTIGLADTGQVTVLNELEAGSLDINGVADISGVLTTHSTVNIGATQKLYLDGGSNTYITESSADVISFYRGGSHMAYIDSAGIFSLGNVYTGNSGQFRNYGGTWTASTGLTGNGFQFVNSVDGTPLTLSSTGNAVFAGTIGSGAITSTSHIEAAQHFKATNNNISFHAGGTQVLNIDVNKNIYPSTDGDTDLGFSDSSLRFRNGYFTGELQSGSLDINGDADISGHLYLATTKELHFSGSGGDTYIRENAANNLQFVVGANQKLVLGNSGTVHYQHFKITDSYQLQLGTDADAQFFHTGSHLYLYNATGDITFRNNADGADILFQSDNGSGGDATYFRLDGSEVETRFHKATLHYDNVWAKFGDSGDLRIYHDGSNSYIHEAGTGALKIQASQITINNAAGTEAMLNATQDGAVNLYYNGQGPKISTGNYGPTFKYSVTGTTDGNSAGDIVNIGETTTVAGKIYYLNSSGGWTLADADAESTAKGMLAVALGTSSSTNGMLIRGMVTLDHDPGTVGDTLFLHTTAGQASSTAPSGNGDIVRVIGYCLDSTNGQIYFNPDGTFVEVTA